MDNKIWSGIGAVVGAALMTVVGFVGGFLDSEPKQVIVNNDGGSVIVQMPDGVCNEGWTPDPQQDDHAVVLRCVQGDKVVILHPDFSFSHGWIGEPDEFIFDPESEALGW